MSKYYQLCNFWPIPNLKLAFNWVMLMNLFDWRCLRVSVCVISAIFWHPFSSVIRGLLLLSSLNLQYCCLFIDDVISCRDDWGGGPAHMNIIYIPINQIFSSCLSWVTQRSIVRRCMATQPVWLPIFLMRGAQSNGILVAWVQQDPVLHHLVFETLLQETKSEHCQVIAGTENIKVGIRQKMRRCPFLVTATLNLVVTNKK